MTRQPSQSPIIGPSSAVSNGPSRLQGANSSSLLPRQFSFSQVSEAGSGLAASGSRVDQDGYEASGPSWAGSPPSSSWLAKAASSHSQPSAITAPSVPVPPAADEQVSMLVAFACQSKLQPCNIHVWLVCTSQLNLASCCDTCCVSTMYKECSHLIFLQEWPELGGGTASHAGHQSSASTEQPATPAMASEPSHANSHQSELSNGLSTKSTPKADAASRSPNKASSSPDQRLPSTPSPANSHPHSPETPLSGQTTATTSSVGTSPAALQSQQQHRTAHSAQQHQRDAPDGVAQQAESQQQQQHGLVQLPVISSSDVQRDPVVQLASRRSSGRVPPPGFSRPVAAPSSPAGPSSQGHRHKVCALCNMLLEACRL